MVRKNKCLFYSHAQAALMLYGAGGPLPRLPFITAENTMPPSGEGGFAFNFSGEIGTKSSELSPIMKMINTTARLLCNIPNTVLE